MMIPAACVPVLVTEPSINNARSISCIAIASSENRIFKSSIQDVSVVPGSIGIVFAILSAKFKNSFLIFSPSSESFLIFFSFNTFAVNALATKRIDPLGAAVATVEIPHTQSFP